MRNRYMPILYVGMVFAAFAASFHSLDRISRSFTRNPSKVRPAAALPAEIPEAALSETTLSDIRSALEKQEYHISYDAQKKKLQSPNRRNNIRAYYEPGKLTVQTRVDTTGEGFKVELVNEGVFADGKLLYMPEANAKAEHHENKVQISHNAFTEEFINNEDGVRQNFIIEDAPEGTRQLQVKMTAKGLEIEQGTDNELRFYSKTNDSHTRNKLVYSDLKCWDANKKPLNASLAYVDNHIEISVDVAGAAYPVTIDPIIANGTPQNANKVLEINQSYMWLGFSVSSAGDVNGDGYSDVIVGAPQYDLGQDGEGAAFVYKGDPSGLTLTAITLEVDQAGAKMGYSVASAGDFNGDGFSDVIVGIPFYDQLAVDQGYAMLYLGSDNFFTSPITGGPLGFVSQAGAYYGISVSTAGDVNGDGFSDVLIGASQSSTGESKEGIVRLFYGNGNGTPGPNLTVQFDQANAMFGYSVAPAGDVDADGFSDIIVGARYYTNGQGEEGEGAAFIYRGGSGGLKGNPVIIEGNQYNAALGNKVSSAGDVNGDGYSDVLISAYLYDAPNLKDRGVVYLHLGSSTGINPVSSKTFYGVHENDHLGSSVACAGDVNGDGYSDILLGAEYYDNGQFNEGVVAVCHGSKDVQSIHPNSMLESNQANGWFGTAVSSAGDVNGDGYSDILVGCYTFDNGQTDEGHVFVYHGGAEGVGTNGAITLSGTNSGAMMGASVASAGDVNSDGFDDVIAGAPDFDFNGTTGGVAMLYYGSAEGIQLGNQVMLSKNKSGSYFGCSVAAAGDINADGYGDIVIGAREYNNGENHEGVAFIYYGSNSGINVASCQLIEKNIANSSFGASVSGAGDINKDGYADLAIGCPGFSAGPNNMVGAVFVYYGSLNGPVNPVTLQGYSANTGFGGETSCAGDINGDGYSDIIVGAAYSDFGELDEGAAFIFYGTPGGIMTAAKILQSNQAGAHFGASASAAGDVNGDGYGDVIVGAPFYDNAGAAILYYGSGGGISEVNPPPTLLDVNSPNAQFGSSVGSAGDVNGDGYADIIVGACNFSGGESNEGKAFVFHGGQTGIKSTAALGVESNQVNANLGCSVSDAGDVNGDGYSDIIVSAPHANYNQTNDVGSATVYYGNNGNGIKNNVRLFNSDLVTPLNHNQFNQPNFVATLFAKSFLGGNKGKFVWEAMGPGVPFSKVGANPITTSNQFTGVSGSFINLFVTGSLLGAPVTKIGTATKLRVRVRYSPVLAITGQMYGPWRYLQSQMVGYNNAPVPEEAMTETINNKANAESSDESAVTLFPNPVSDRLSIQTTNPGDIRSIRLFDTAGKLLFQSPQFEKDIDVSKLPGGVYILILNRADGTPTSHRILIRR